MSCTNDCQRPTPAQAHCSVCHRTFGAVSGFDRHRRNGTCLDPATLDMSEVGRIWRQQLSQSGRLRVDQLRQRAATGSGVAD